MSKIRQIIRDQYRGSGGGGKGGGGDVRAPVEAPDTLRSVQKAKMVILTTEGEAGGLVDSFKSVYFNDTPVQNPDGTFNFTNVTMVERFGTQDQEPIPGFDGAEAETIVGTEVKNSAAVVRSISNANDTAVRITLGFPQMTLQNTETGDLNGTSVSISIDIQNNGGGFIPQALRQLYQTSAFQIGGAGGVTNVESQYFHVTVGWVGQSIQSPQTCRFQLQYRAVGDTTWLVNQEYTFSGSATVNTGGIGGLGTNPTAPQYGGGLGGYNSLGQYVVMPGGSKTFALTLPKDTYEFRVVKLSGSIQNTGIFGSPAAPSVGVAYGGYVSITGGDAYVPVYSDTITGKTTSRYQKAYRLSLPSPGPWDIRVRRLTADNGSATLQNKTFWDSFTEIIDGRLSHPNSALIAIMIDARQFNAIPTIGFDMYGILLKVPSNYDPLLRTYDGSWDGTFKVAWTDNPAWVFYDFVTNDRYGLGGFIDASQVDKWALYTIAQFCDEMVQDGFGGLEPRYTCNMYLQTREQAYTVIANLASIFSGMAWWSTGAITVTQDAPGEVKQLFTPSNIVGKFKYSGSSGRVRHTVALVGWNDPQDGYRQKIEYVEDAAGIARYGVIQTEVIAVGCTSRGQAHRLGRRIIYTELYEAEVNSWTAGMDVVFSGPGDIVNTADPIRAGMRIGGRLLAATESQVQLDAPFTIEIGKSYLLSCRLPDGSVEKVGVTNAPGTSDIMDVSPAFSVAPQVMAMWIMSSDTLVPESWRIVHISESDGANFDITALAYRPDKYAAIEQNLILEPLPTSILNGGQPDAPGDLSFTESLYLSGLSVVAVNGTVSWQTVPGAVSYGVTYQRMAQNPVLISGILINSIDIKPMTDGDYTISVYAVNTLGRRSQDSVINVHVYGKTIPPVDVTGFSISKQSGMAFAAWNLHPDLDVQVGGQIVIRHSPMVVDAFWEDGIIYDAFAGNAINGLLPLATGTYMAKALDSSGNWSDEMVSFVASEGMVTGFVTVATSTQHPNFIGTKAGTATGDGLLQLASAETIGSMPGLISSWPKLSSLGGVKTFGTYEFDQVMDLGTVATRRIEAHIAAQSFDTGDRISARGLISTWGSITGNAVNDCDGTIYMATTDDDPAGSPTWSAWTPFFTADATCRAIKFKLELISGTVTHNIRVFELSVKAKEPV